MESLSLPKIAWLVPMLASSTSQSANIVNFPLFTAHCALQLSDDYAIISLCRNQCLTRKQTWAELVDVKGWKKTPHQIYKTALLRPTANKQFSWFMGNLSVPNIKLWHFLSGQADWGLSPKVEPGCSFSWCLCCWRRLWCLPVRGVSRRIESAAGESAICKLINSLQWDQLCYFSNTWTQWMEFSDWKSINGFFLTSTKTLINFHNTEIKSSLTHLKIKLQRHETCPTQTGTD